MTLNGRKKLKFGVTTWIVTLISMLATHLANAGEPFTLPRALDFALANNPDVRICEQRIHVSQAVLKQANAAFSPQLQLQSSYARTDNPMQAFGSILNQRSFYSGMDFNQVPDVDDFNAKGLLTMPLYAGGRNVAGRKAAQANAEAARKDAEAVRKELSLEIARAFHTLIKTRKFIAATSAGVRAFETNLVIAENRLADGAGLKNDVLDVEVRLAQAREERIRAQNASQLAERALRNLLGLEQGTVEIDEHFPAPSEPEAGDFSRRPELAAVHYRQQAAEADVKKAGAGYLPRISAFSSVDYDYGWKLEGDGTSYSAGLMAQWDIWDGQATKAKVREAKANWAIAREEERKTRLALDLESEQARLACQEAKERLKVTEKMVAQAAESTELTRDRYHQGLALASQLIASETALIMARVRRAEAEADKNIAVAAWRKALGLQQL
jgi:outer membrane protein